MKTITDVDFFTSLDLSCAFDKRSQLIFIAYHGIHSTTFYAGKLSIVFDLVVLFGGEYLQINNVVYSRGRTSANYAVIFEQLQHF